MTTPDRGGCYPHSPRHPHFEGLIMLERHEPPPKPEPKPTHVRTHMVRITTEVEEGADTAGLAFFIETGEELPLGNTITKAEDVASWEGREPFDHRSMREGLAGAMFRTMLNRGAQPTVGLRFLSMDLANLALTGEPKFPSDTEAKDESIEDFGVTRDALKRVVDAFYGRNGLDNTDLLKAMENADRLLEGNP